MKTENIQTIQWVIEKEIEHVEQAIHVCKLEGLEELVSQQERLEILKSARMDFLQCNPKGGSHSKEKRNELDIPPGYAPCDIGWEYEDMLNPELSKAEYDAMFPYSRVVHGVRIFPFLRVWEDHQHNSIRAYFPFHNSKYDRLNLNSHNK